MTTCAATCPHVEVRLIDRPETDENPHLDFVLTDAVRAVERLRAEGRKCCCTAWAPTAAPDGRRTLRRSAMRHQHQASSARCPVGPPRSHPNPAFRAALKRLDPTSRQGEVNG